MDKEKKYIVPDGEDKINKAEEPAAEYCTSYMDDVQKNFEQEWERGITVDEFRLRLKDKLRLRYER